MARPTQLGSSRCAGRATKADSHRGHGPTRSQRLARSPSEPTPNGRRTICEDASTQQLGAP
eukprot:11679955-Alexandrium_andersonii.AAC.1